MSESRVAGVSSGSTWEENCVGNGIVDDNCEIAAQTPVKTRLCWFCRESGHLKRSCPVKASKVFRATIKKRDKVVQDVDTESRGSVVWFDMKKGYGFIEQTAAPDLFVHITELGPSVVRLRAGENVVFNIARGLKGLEAVNVRTDVSVESVNKVSARVTGIGLTKAGERTAARAGTGTTLQADEDEPVRVSCVSVRPQQSALSFLSPVASLAPDFVRSGYAR